MKKMLIVGSGSYLGPLSIRIRSLAPYLTKDWDITVMVPSADKYNNFTPNKTIKTPAGIRLVQPWQFLTHSAMLNLLPYLFSSLLTIFRRRYNVIYLYKPTPITILALLPKFFRGTPVVVDFDDLGSEVMKLEGQSALNYRLVASCERIALRHASAIVVTSTYLTELMTKRYPGKPLLRIPNGVEPADYMIAKTDDIRAAVYYFGVINRLPIVEDLIKAMPAVLKTVPETMFTIAGGGAALDEAKKLAQHVGIADKTKFTGYLSNMLDIQHYVHYGDIALCFQPDTPTVRASSNMKVFQYMAMGSVPVVGDVGDLRAYVRDGQAGVAVPVGKPDELARVLIELLQDTERRRAIAQTTHQLAQTDYSWSHLADQLNQFLQTEVTGKK